MKALLLILLACIAAEAGAAARFSQGTGAWGSTARWGTSCGGGGGSSIPGAGDDVTICNATNITLDANRTVNTLTINNGGTLSLSTFTLAIDNTTATAAFTLVSGGVFNANTSTVQFTNPASENLTGGTGAGSITFYNLTVNPAPSGTPRTYTFGGALTVNNNFLIDVQSAGAAARAVTVTLGGATVVGASVLTGLLTIQANGNETANLNTAGFALTTRNMNIGTAGTLTANASTVTLNGNSGTLLTRTGTLTAGTSTFVMSPTASVTLTSGTFTTTNAFNNLTVSPAANSITGTFGAGNISVGGTLTLGNGVNTAVTVTANTNSTILDVAGDVGISANTTFVGHASNSFTVAGDWTNDGTYTASAGTVTFDGTAAQAIGGANDSNFSKLTINNTIGTASTAITLNRDETVSSVLTLTAGIVATGTNTLTASGACATNVVRPLGGGWVAGNLQMAFAAGSLSCTFPLGDATANYTPLQLAFSALGTAGSITASTTNEDHRNTTAGTSGIDATKSVNRYWSLKNSSLAGTCTATMTYITGTGDNDSGTTTSNYRIRKGASCSGSATARTCAPWSTLTVSGTPNSTTAAASPVTLTADSPLQADIAVGEPDATTNFLREKQFIYTRETY